MKTLKELNSKWYWRLVKIIYLTLGILVILPILIEFFYENVKLETLLFEENYITIDNLKKYGEKKPITNRLIYANIAAGKEFEGMAFSSANTGFWEKYCGPDSQNQWDAEDIIFENLIKGNQKQIFLSQACVDMIKNYSTKKGYDKNIQNTIGAVGLAIVIFTFITFILRSTIFYIIFGKIFPQK